MGDRRKREHSRLFLEHSFCWQGKIMMVILHDDVFECSAQTESTSVACVEGSYGYWVHCSQPQLECSLSSSALCTILNIPPVLLLVHFGISVRWSPIFSEVMEIVHLFLSWYHFGQEGNFKKCSGWCFCVLMAVVGVQRLGLSFLPKI